MSTECNTSICTMRGGKKMLLADSEDREFLFFSKEVLFLVSVHTMLLETQTHLIQLDITA